MKTGSWIWITPLSLFLKKSLLSKFKVRLLSDYSSTTWSKREKRPFPMLRGRIACQQKSDWEEECLHIDRPSEGWNRRGRGGIIRYSAVESAGGTNNAGGWDGCGDRGAETHKLLATCFSRHGERHCFSGSLHRDQPRSTDRHCFRNYVYVVFLSSFFERNSSILINKQEFVWKMTFLVKEPFVQLKELFKKELF